MLNKVACRLRLILALATWFSDIAGPTMFAASFSANWPLLAVPSPSYNPIPTCPEELGGVGAHDVSQPRNPGNEAVAQLQLPDLRTLPPSDLEIQRRSGGRRVLRLANMVWNSGAGALELLGEFNRVTQQTHVIQRVYTADGVVADHFVGTFVWHPNHDHWHIEDFAVYQLWRLTAAGELDRVVAHSAKLSYCLIDTDIVASEHPGFDPRRHYYGCGRTRQGLSVGWGDKYDSFLDGQSLDVSGVVDGVYALVSTTNPNAQLLEANYTNNTTILYLNIVGERVTVVPSPELAPAQCQAAGRC